MWRRDTDGKHERTNEECVCFLEGRTGECTESMYVDDHPESIKRGEEDGS